MTGSPFTYPAWDLLTLTGLDSLPYGGVTFGEVLNQAGPWAGRLPLADPRAQQLNWNSSSRPGRTLLGVDLNGVLVWGGVVWTRSYQEKTKALTVGAMEIGSYFTRRQQAADYTSTFTAGTDPMQIAKRVIQDALAVAATVSSNSGTIGGGITVTLNPVGGSGQLVQASYPGTQLQTVDSIVSNLSQMGYTFGYDYSFDVAYVPGTRTPGITLNLWYPRKGRTADQSQIVLMHKDTLDFTYPEDGIQAANSINETGAGSGGVQPVKVSALTPGYPLLETSVSHSDVSDLSILSNMAFGDLEQLCYPVVTPTVTIPVPLPDITGAVDPSFLTFGQFTVGDEFTWRIDPVAGGGENTSPRFPSGMNFAWRINQWTCTAADKGVSSILLDLGLPLINTIPPPQAPL